MYTLETIKNELNELSKQVGDDEFNIPVSINSRFRTTLGRVSATGTKTNCKPNAMEFSKSFIESETDEHISQTIKHEFAHYWAIKSTHNDHGHDALFKKICNQIGCYEDQTEAKYATIENNKDKYIVYCPTCGIIGGYKRMCNTLKNLSRCKCGICGKSELYYEQNY